jgi:hypothetical protein
MPPRLLSALLVGLLIFVAASRAAEPAPRFIPTFAVKYGASTGWPGLEDAAKFDVLVLGGGTARSKAHPTIPGNTWQVLKAMNPRQIQFLYEIGPGEYNTASWGRIGDGWEWVKREHGPGSADRWTAVGARSGECLQGRQYANERLMLPGNPAWQQYWLDNVYARHWGDAAKADAIADGVFADNSSFTFPYPGGWFREGHPDSSEVPADFSPDGVKQEEPYHSQIKSFFVRAVPWLAAKNAKLALNFGNMVRRPQDWEELDALPNPPLLAMEEGAFVHPWGGKGSFVFCPEKEWLNQVQTIAGLRHVRALMNVHGPVATDVDGIARMDARDASGNRAWDVLWYAMASFLQGVDLDRPSAYMNFTVWGYAQFHWFEEFDPHVMHLGSARGASQRVEGGGGGGGGGHVYVRAFDKGWAVVNPSDKPAQGVAVPEGEARVIDHETLEQPEKSPLVSRFDLAAHRGIILLRAGKVLVNKASGR